MSWSVDYTTFNDSEIRFVGEDNAENNAAMQAAVDAVGQIIASGALGDPATKRFAVRVGGHSNPANEPVPGNSNDYVNINIFQMETDE